MSIWENVARHQGMQKESPAWIGACAEEIISSSIEHCPIDVESLEHRRSFDSYAMMKNMKHSKFYADPPTTKD
ncbi:hypothetical protein TNCV_1811931 [Trichonephila clavipes]|uniref:Uncharacterized protein n=1 Tax=Trichonephila clavipes TaxID=2585209 RepID=A0A8X7BFU4_TRICX|nr:hypothetical protein TNCV_1811931 [Trichonephila clavipes]